MGLSGGKVEPHAETLNAKRETLKGLSGGKIGAPHALNPEP